MPTYKKLWFSSVQADQGIFLTGCLVRNQPKNVLKVSLTFVLEIMSIHFILPEVYRFQTKKINTINQGVLPGFLIVIVVERATLKRLKKNCLCIFGAKKGAIFSLIYFFESFCIYCIPQNYIIPQAMPHAIPQTHSGFYPHRKTAAMLVSQTNPLGVELFPYANDFICYNNLHRCWPRERKHSMSTSVL